jgi:hypothetical protein
MPSDKARGPDGYTGRFYKAAWQVISGDFMSAISRLLQGDVTRLYLLNSAYITLLPKKTEAIEVKDFRPISLVHSFAKIVTKIMANRLAPKPSNLVSANQSAFVKGRCIHDNFLLVHGTARALHNLQVLRVLLKLDVTKAFDSVSWPFLLEVIQHLAFGPVWCSVLSKLLRSSSTRVLVNEEPGDLILHQRGLRQGDPLSPMLFILVMDVLNSLVLKASEQNLLQPLMGGSRRQRGQMISLYADDVVLFLQPQPTELSLVKVILRVFGEAFGLVTNFSKCSLTPITCGGQEIQSVQQLFPCSMVQFPYKYLGLPLSVQKLPKAVFYSLIEAIADRLHGWKASLIHSAGRATLVKAVLSSIPIYI